MHVLTYSCSTVNSKLLHTTFCVGHSYDSENYQNTNYHTNLNLYGKTVRIGCASGFWGDTSIAGKFYLVQNIDILIGFNLIVVYTWVS